MDTKTNILADDAVDRKSSQAYVMTLIGGIIR